ncbi:MAG: type IV pilus assembly protein PilM [Patescibacteria group bacterium]
MAKKSYLGVDIGAAGVKVVELSEAKGRPLLETYGFSERNPDEYGANLLDSPKETASLLKDILKRAGTRTTKAVAGLPVASIFSSVITVPVLAGKELAAAIEAQAKKFINLPSGEVVLDWKQLPTAEAKPKALQIFVTGAPKTLVQKYVDIFKLTGLELVSLETEAFALIRSLIGKDRSVILILDIGAVRTNLMLVEAGIPLLSRSLNVGGLAITQTLAGQLGVTPAEAEQMKSDAVGAPSNEQSVPKVVADFFAPVVQEVKYLSDLYVKDEKNAGKLVEKMVVTGGSALIPNVAAHLAGVLGMKVFLGDPWARVLTPEPLSPVLASIGARFSVAAGLAMRELE